MTDTPAGPLERAARVFERALRLPEEERGAYFERTCAGDPALRLLIEDLVRAHAARELSLPGAEGRGKPAPDRSSALSDIAEVAGGRIGPYKLLQKLGEGGFGVVFMAEQEHPVRRRVALKVIKLGMDTRQVVARFEQERQALALMDHPCIARVLDAGATQAGRAYFVMELVRGVPVTEYCDANHLGTRERLALFLPICRAIQHAHQKGIIHRDIKPSNVLVTLHDGKPVPKVIDFGIAKATDRPLTDKTLFTELRAMVGTPAYMSPEQAELSGLDVDTRSDVYSLGVLLYELLTGTPPFSEAELRAAGMAGMQRLIREVDPPRPSTRVSTLGEALVAVAARRRTEPRRLGRTLRGDLDWIVMKALEKDRARRYDTATSLAQDVERQLAGEPVLAAPPGLAYRASKLARRHKGRVGAAAAVVSVLLLSLFYVVQQLPGLFAALDASERAAADLEDIRIERDASLVAAREGRRVAKNEAYVANLLAAQNALESREFPNARDLLGVCPEEERHFEWNYLNAYAHEVEYALPGDFVSFSKDSSRILTVEWDWDEEAVVSDVPGGRTLRRTRYGEIHPALSPDGEFLLEMSVDGVQVWEIGSGEEVLRLPYSHGDFGVGGYRPEFSLDGTRVLLPLEQTIRVLGWHSRAIVQTFTFDFECISSPGNAVALSPDGRRLVRVMDHLSAVVWDVDTKDTVSELRGLTAVIVSFSFSLDGRLLLTGGQDGTVSLWDVESSELMYTFSDNGWIKRSSFDLSGDRILTEGASFKAYDAGDYGLVYSKIGERFSWMDRPREFFVYEGDVIRAYDASSGEVRSSRPRHEHDGLVVASPDGEHQIVVSQEGVLGLPGQAAFGVRIHRSGVYSGGRGWITVLSGGTRALLQSSDSLLRFVDLGRGVSLPWSPAVYDIYHECVSPNGAYFVGAVMMYEPGGHSGQECWLFDGRNGQQIVRLDAPDHRVVSAAFSEDGEHVATIDRSGVVLVRSAAEDFLEARVFDANASVADTNRDLFSPRPAPGVARHYDLRKLWFSPDARCIVAQNELGMGIVWSLETGDELARAEVSFGVDPCLDDEPGFIVFDPSGARLVVSSASDKLEILDLDFGGEPMVLGTPVSGIAFVEFDATGTRLITRGAVQRLWNVDRGAGQTTGQEMLAGEPCNETSQAFSLDFSPDGSHLAASLPGQINVFDLRGTESQPTPTPIQIDDGHLGFLCFDRDGSRLATADAQGTIQVWTSDGEELGTWRDRAPKAEPGMATFLPEGDALVAFWGSRGLLFRLSGEQPVVELGPLLASAASIETDARGRLVIRGAERRIIGVLDPATGAELLGEPELPDGAGHLVSKEFNEDLSRAILKTSRGAALLFDAEDGSNLAELWPASEVAVVGVMATEEGRFLVTASGRDARAEVWDGWKAKERVVLRGHKGGVRAVDITPDGSRALTGSTDGTAILWDAASGDPLKTFKEHDRPVVAVAISENAERVLTATEDGTVRLWDATSEQVLTQLGGHEGPLLSAAFSRDGEHLMTLTAESVRLWDGKSGGSLRTVEAPGKLAAARFSADGRALVAVGEKGETGIVYVLPLDPSAAPSELELAAPGCSLAFHRDGAQLLVGTSKGWIHLFDLRSGLEEARMRAPDEQPVMACALSSDHRRILAASEGGTIHIFDPMRPDQALLSLNEALGPTREMWLCPEDRRIVTLSKEGDVVCLDTNPDPWTETTEDAE